MIVVDVETTGLDPNTCSIVSIGAMNFSMPKMRFYQECRIWEGAQVSEKALEINGFTMGEIRDPCKQSVEDTVLAFLGWAESIEDRTLAGHNPTFDRDFLRASARRYGVSWSLGYRTVDLHTLCYARYLMLGISPLGKGRTTAISLDMALDFVGLPPEPRPHNALVGAVMEAEAISRLILGKPLCCEFMDMPITAIT